MHHTQLPDTIHSDKVCSARPLAERSSVASVLEAQTSLVGSCDSFTLTSNCPVDLQFDGHAATNHYLSNQQFSITAVTTSTGSVAERYAYTAYGQPTFLDASGTPLTTQTSTLNDRYLYTGREWDATLGLYHFRARWMSPSAGRFLGRDPIGYVDGFSLFHFYLGLARNDPFGLCLDDSKIPQPELTIKVEVSKKNVAKEFKGTKRYVQEYNDELLGKDTRGWLGKTDASLTFTHIKEWKTIPCEKCCDNGQPGVVLYLSKLETTIKVDVVTTYLVWKNASAYGQEDNWEKLQTKVLLHELLHQRDAEKIGKDLVKLDERQKGPYSHKGCKPKTDEEKKVFYKGIDDQITQLENDLRNKFNTQFFEAARLRDIGSKIFTPDYIR